MKAILLLAAVYSLIINQSQKKAPVNNNYSQQPTSSGKEQVAEKSSIVYPLQAKETIKDHAREATLLYGTLSIFNAGVER